ncbi:hypothetical protein DFH09DRAFT_1122744 [Mycena vulgaris]|nr:hypothetical protein DFH09DRAFT_1122744 [Mycena vulgaris]
MLLAPRAYLGSQSLVFLLGLFTLVPHYTAAQTYINGQTFTNGLAIIDSPSPSNPGHAGSTMPIAVDVSGDGKLSPAASLPGSGLSTSYELLEIYLVSAQTSMNITVSAGPGLLTNESGSTVKHLNWPIPTCVPSGDYNLTFYETSHFNGQRVFTITPIPIPISNPSTSGQCSNLNALQPQPQNSTPLSQSPFSSGSASSGSAIPVSSSSSGMIQVIRPGLTVTLAALFLTSLQHSF